MLNIILPLVGALVAMFCLLALLNPKRKVILCSSRRVLSGRVVIITGGNSGIGLETARDLAARNARVILACVSLAKGQEASLDIIHTTGNQNVVAKLLDLSSFESVREFARDILENETRLNVLINNAGSVFPNRQVSADGLEMTMMVNYFGHFLLTNLLMPLLKKSAPARIVLVASSGHRKGQILRGVSQNNLYSLKNAYNDSKLANVMFTRELSRRLRGSGVTVNCLHPGVVKTDMYLDYIQYQTWAVKILFSLIQLTATEGAQTTIHLAVSEVVEGVSGKYFYCCKEVEPHKKALDFKIAKYLWEYSMKVTKSDPEAFRFCSTP